jgi:hypothetical protein
MLTFILSLATGSLFHVYVHKFMRQFFNLTSDKSHFFANRITCQIYTTSVVYRAFSALVALYFYNTPVDNVIPHTYLSLQYMLAYFLYDLGAMLTVPSLKSNMYIAHHCVGIYMILSNMTFDMGPRLVNGIMFTLECSTPLLNLRDTLKQMNQTTSVIYRLNAHYLMVLYGLVRVLGLQLVLAIYLSTDFEYQLHEIIQVTCAECLGVASMWWYYLLWKWYQRWVLRPSPRIQLASAITSRL